MNGTGRTHRLDVVLDTNVVAAWSYLEVDTCLALRVRAVLLSGSIRAWVPELFWAEFQHVGRRKMAEGVSRADVEAAYGDAQVVGLNEMPVLEDLRAPAWQLILDHSLGSYDAYFLALALELGIDLWTFDQRSLCDRLPAGSPLRERVSLIGVDPLPI